MNRLRKFVFVTTLALLPVGARATLIEAATVETMAAEADLIVLGTVTGVASRMQDGRIVTDAHIAAFRTWKGDEGLESLTITALGGRVGDLAQRVPSADQYDVGRDVLVFLEAAPDGTWRSSRLGFSAFTVEYGTDALLRAVRQADGVVLTVNTATGALDPAPSSEPAVFELPALEEAIDRTLAPVVP
jgi:hypothetical protein